MRRRESNFPKSISYLVDTPTASSYTFPARRPRDSYGSTTNYRETQRRRIDIDVATCANYTPNLTLFRDFCFSIRTIIGALYLLRGRGFHLETSTVAEISIAEVEIGKPVATVAAEGKTKYTEIENAQNERIYHRSANNRVREAETEDMKTTRRSAVGREIFDEKPFPSNQYTRSDIYAPYAFRSWPN